jgi:hypothetical protein
MAVLKWQRRIYSRTQRPPRPKSSVRGYVHTPPEHGGPYQRIDPLKAILDVTSHIKQFRLRQQNTFCKIR